MPNAIGPTGLTLATRAELLAFYTAQYQLIYGPDIDLSSNTPDGQMLNIFIQSILDLEDLLAQIYNMFDPDNAIGVILDQRVAINGIQRQAGTFTITNITLVNSTSVNLYGLDQSVQPVYTIADNAGNQWQLQASQVGLAAGTHVLAFQAAEPGAVLTVPNTITSPVTIVLGVTSVNNPTTYTTLGQNEETDAALKVRRQISVSLGSQGYLAGLLAALENVPGVTSAFVYENNTDSTDGDGIPSHTIWVIVSGSGAAADIAHAIYTKRNAGAGMFGTVTFSVPQVDGSHFTVRWDVVVPETLFIKFTATSIDGINAPNIAAIRAQLPVIYVPGVSQEVDINSMACKVQEIDPNCLVTGAGFATAVGGPYTNTLSPSAKNKQFAVSSPNIVITPMILSPTTAVVNSGNTQQFTGLGGYGALIYSILVNNSGGSINAVTGLYTAGATTGVTDTVKVVDSLANSATASVQVP